MSNLSFLSGFDASEISDDFELIATGDYEAMITDAEMVENSKGTGSFLKVTLTITSGGYDGRLLFDRFNLIHTNPKAVEIAQKQFASLCKATGVLTPSDSSELYEIAIVVSVDVDGEYNRVKRYKAVSDVAAVTPAPKAPAPVPAPTPKKRKARKPKVTDDVPGLTPDTGVDPNDDLPF